MEGEGIGGGGDWGGCQFVKLFLLNYVTIITVTTITITIVTITTVTITTVSLPTVTINTITITITVSQKNYFKI